MNLYTQLGFQGDARDVPISGVPVSESAEAIVMPCVPAGRQRNQLPGFWYLFDKPESRIPFSVTVFKTLNYCHLCQTLIHLSYSLTILVHYLINIPLS